MATPTPTSQHWTLRLKYARTTIIIPAKPTSSFSEIKQHLVAALLATGRTKLGGHDLASLDVDTLELGVPIDQWDLKKGWVALEVLGDEEGDDDRKGKSKKKLAINSSPQGAGLRDGAALAFRFEHEDSWDVEIPAYEDDAADAMDEA